MNWKKLAVAALITIAAGFRSSWAVSPSLNATISGHGVTKDGQGIVFPNGNADVGYKVWITTDTNPHLITDELGNVVIAGTIQKICMSSGAVTEWGVVYDSNTVQSLTQANANTQASIVLQVTENTQRLAAAHTCQIYDSQFWNGAVPLQTGNSLGGNMTVYWRPARGGSN